MASTLNSRGPDDGGVWVSQSENVALAHRRLAVVDLSPGGHQPMPSADGRLVLLYNGELYNFKEMRADLETKGHFFKTSSDSEVLVEACAIWGIDETVRRCIGMFAFALWDCESRYLTLVRDRIGIKPLYWAQFNGTFLFGSEIKALRAHPSFQACINTNVIAPFLRYNYIPAPQTIYRNVHKLEPGCLLKVRGDQDPKIIRYWGLNETQSEDFTGGALSQDSDPLVGLETVLSDAIVRRMVGDVPIGAFLSSGIDSSAIVAIMQRNSPRPIKTFTIGYEEEGRDESRVASRIARYIGTEHHTLLVKPQDAANILTQIPYWYDEPFADTSQIPTCLLSHFAREKVTVALSGDGGDELFGGYKRYLRAANAQALANKMPQLVRTGLSRTLAVLPPLLTRLPLVHPKSASRLARRFHQLARGLALEQADPYDRQLWRRWEDPALLMQNSLIHQIAQRQTFENYAPASNLKSIVAKMQYADLLSYLPENNLVKVDRASMGASLEVRVPLLDHRVVEFAWKLPYQMRIRNKQGKWLLRQLLHKYVPQDLVERPKQGFGAPLTNWLRGPLHDWCEELLSTRALKSSGIFECQRVRSMWEAHRDGTENWKRPLWNVLMLQAWYREWM